MAGERMIGPIQVAFRYEGHLCVLSCSGDVETEKRVSGTSQVIEGREVPTWIELTTSGGADPDMRVRVEIRDGAPQIVELAWTSKPHQGEIRQKHLRQVDLAKLATDLVVTTMQEGQPFLEDPLPGPEDRSGRAEHFRRSKRMAEKFVERQRRPREYRVITDSFLKSVAEVYRENIHGAPTKAVAKHFDVKGRMASTYVDRARRAGYLPPTKQGQKKA
jgi:hypothetical protein